MPRRHTQLLYSRQVLSKDQTELQTRDLVERRLLWTCPSRKTSQHCRASIRGAQHKVALASLI